MIRQNAVATNQTAPLVIGGVIVAITAPALAASVIPGDSMQLGFRWMSPFSAVTLLALGVALVCQARGSSKRVDRVGRSIALVVTAMALVRLVPEVRQVLSVVIETTPSSPLIALCIFATGGSLALSSRSRVSTALAGVALVGCVLIISDRVYHTDLLQNWGVEAGATIDEEVAALLAAFAALLRHREHRFIAALARRDEAGSMLRRSLAGATLVPTLLGALVLFGNRSGLYRPETQTALLALGSMAVLILVSFSANAKSLRANRERLRAGAALAASELRYRNIFERASVGIARLTSDGRWQQANERLCTMLGYTEAELREKTYGELSHLDDVTLDAQQWEMLRRGDIGDYGIERRFVSKQGEIVHTDVRLVREVDAEGALRFIAVIQDITGRKLSEGTLRVYERAIACTQNGIVIADARKPDRPIVSVNAAFLAITGYAIADVLGKNCRFLNASARGQPAIAELRQAIQRGESCSVLLRNHRANGEPFWNQLSVAPVHDKDGELTNFVGTLIDATESVRSLEEREQLLRAARDGQRAAEAANDAKDRFLSVISHELRSPMNAILAWTSILGDEAQPQQVRALESIEASVRAQARLVDDLVIASRLRTGGLGIEFSDVDVAAAIEAAVHRLLPVAREKAVTIDVRLPGSRAMCYADGQRIQQIVHNLIDNAIKFTPAQGRVTVELSDRKEHWAIEVRDTGCGLSADSLGRVFDEFWRADSKGKGAHKGLGLGLAIVKNLVEGHGGSVRVESAGLGLGATFTVELPKAEPGSRTVAVASTAPLAIAAEAANLAGAEVVVVEDDPALLESLGALLARAKAVPRLASSVATALTHFETLPEALISDIGLPDRDGLELIRCVRAMPEPFRSVCAVAVTGQVDPLDRKRIFRAGFDSYLAKPVDPQAVLQRVSELLSMRSNPTPPLRRLVLLADDRTRKSGIEDVLRADGHEVTPVPDAAAAFREATESRPDGIVAPTWAGPSVNALAERLAAVQVRSIFVGVLEHESEGELGHFDFIVQVPDWTALRRVLRFLEEPLR
jgi:PAS domain S-box-containing protein